MRASRSHPELLSLLHLFVSARGLDHEPLPARLLTPRPLSSLILREPPVLAHYLSWEKHTIRPVPATIPPS